MQNYGATVKTQFYTQGDHYVAIIFTERNGTEHIVSFNEGGIGLSERREGVTNILFTGH